MPSLRWKKLWVRTSCLRVFSRLHHIGYSNSSFSPFPQTHSTHRITTISYKNFDLIVDWSTIMSTSRASSLFSFFSFFLPIFGGTCWSRDFDNFHFHGHAEDDSELDALLSLRGLIWRTCLMMSSCPTNAFSTIKNFSEICAKAFCCHESFLLPRLSSLCASIFFQRRLRGSGKEFAIRKPSQIAT